MSQTLRSSTLLAFGVLASLAAADPETLNFGIISTESTMNLRKDFQPLAKDLEESLGKKIEMFFAPDYTGVIEAMRFNKVHFGWFGNKSAIEAVDRAHGEVFCQVIDKDGNPGYWSLIIVHVDSPLKTLQDVLAKGSELTFAMGDPQSTSGFLVPGYYAFAANGIDPAKHFKSYRSGANHEANALAVANKQVDASTFNTEAMFRLEQSQPNRAKLIRPVWKSPLIAGDPLVMRNDLSAEMKAKITGFFVNYGKTEEQKAKIMPLKWSGFRASSNAQLLPFRQMALLKDKSKLEKDTEIGAEAKAAKIAEIDKKLAELSEEIKKNEASQASK